MMSSVPTGTIRFSIVIDNYNYGRFLSQAIDSCLAQTYQAHEVIVVDDGSTDNSREILACYEGRSRVKIILQENQGQAAALQHGIDQATGDWILGLDSDDYYKPNCLGEIACRIDDSVDWVYFRATDVDVQGRVIGARPDLRNALMQGEIWKQWILAGRHHTFPPQSFHCYSKRFFDLVKLYPNPRVCLRSAIFPDRYLNILASFECKAVGIESELGCYRDHSGGESKIASRTFPRIKCKLRQQILADEIATEKLHAKGISAAPDFCVYYAYDYWPERLISLVYDPTGHPYRGDTRTYLFFRILSNYVSRRRVLVFGLLRAFFQYGAIAMMPRAIAWKIYNLPSPRKIHALWAKKRRKPASTLAH
jgi:glycosyltransferase involved in cell wall biosynthesis